MARLTKRRERGECTAQVAEQHKRTRINPCLSQNILCRFKLMRSCAFYLFKSKQGLEKSIDTHRKQSTIITRKSSNRVSLLMRRFLGPRRLEEYQGGWWEGFAWRCRMHRPAFKNFKLSTIIVAGWVGGKAKH